jgi:MYXO-CTERM domain-containing protein
MRRLGGVAIAALVAAAIAATASGCTSAELEKLENVGVVDQALNSGFRIPFKCGFETTVTQGNNTNFSHNGEAAYGFDFGVVVNTPLVAAKAGTVSFARNDVKPGNPCYAGGGSGCISTLNYVTIDHGDGTSTLYAHMNSVSVAPGTQVAQGQVIGLSGGTGWSTGPHTHIQRQKNCGIFVCQSIPMSFDDVAGAGVPVGGQAVKSQNGCTGDRPDCELGDGAYCGGNGVKGDAKGLFQCTGGVPKLTETCEFGCKPMPSGTADRCATAEEAPPPAPGADKVDGGTAASSEPFSAAANSVGPSGERSSDLGESDGCSVARGSSTSSMRTLPMFGLAAALLLLVRRRRRHAR